MRIRLAVQGHLQIEVERFLFRRNAEVEITGRCEGFHVGQAPDAGVSGILGGIRDLLLGDRERPLAPTPQVIVPRGQFLEKAAGGRKGL
jgi:hypothetical protein